MLGKAIEPGFGQAGSCGWTRASGAPRPEYAWHKKRALGAVHATLDPVGSASSDLGRSVTTALGASSNAGVATPRVGPGDGEGGDMGTLDGVGQHRIPNVATIFSGPFELPGGLDMFIREEGGEPVCFDVKVDGKRHGLTDEIGVRAAEKTCRAWRIRLRHHKPALSYILQEPGGPRPRGSWTKEAPGCHVDWNPWAAKLGSSREGVGSPRTLLVDRAAGLFNAFATRGRPVGYDGAVGCRRRAIKFAASVDAADQRAYGRGRLHCPPMWMGRTHHKMDEASAFQASPGKRPDEMRAPKAMVENTMVR